MQMTDSTPTRLSTENFIEGYAQLIGSLRGLMTILESKQTSQEHLPKTHCRTELPRGLLPLLVR